MSEIFELQEKKCVKPLNLSTRLVMRHFYERLKTPNVKNKKQLYVYCSVSLARHQEQRTPCTWQV